uniref:Uncharacterized protein n=2 Tax=Anopheles albimanus TaxID=7167 RepID=A0A182FZL9_ANOAL
MLQMVVRVANLVGVAGPPEYRYRFVVVFAFFVVMIVVPKVAFGYPDVGSLITGMAELVFQINNCGGMLILYVLNDDFVEVRDRFQLFVDNVFDDGCEPLLEALRTKHHLFQRLTKAFFSALFCTTNIYCYSPFMFSLFSYWDTLRNENSTMQYFQHMEENFYGLDTRTSFLPAMFCGLLMLPMIYMCGLTGGVKMAMIVNMIGYCAMCFDLISLKLQEVSRRGTHEKEIKEIVKMHQDALQCAKLVEKQVSLVLLLQVVLCVLIWSFILLFLTIKGVRNSQSINLIVLFLFDTAETVAYCYSGDVLSSAGSQVAKAVYHVNWESQTTAVQADLQLILLRAQQPVGVTAGKFSFMSIALFGNLVQKTYSFYIVLRDVI